jgi:DNA-binding transcriptional MerR regulator
MRIGDFARASGVSPRALRHYEEQGLLSPTRLPSGYRDFDPADVEVVHRIRRLLACGVGTATIVDLLPCVADERERLAPTCPEALRRIRHERDRLTRRIEQLHTARHMLDTVLDAGGNRLPATERR